MKILVTTCEACPMFRANRLYEYGYSTGKYYPVCIALEGDDKKFTQDGEYLEDLPNIKPLPLCPANTDTGVTIKLNV